MTSQSEPRSEDRGSSLLLSMDHGVLCSPQSPNRPASIRTLCGAVCSGISWCPQFQRVLPSRTRTEPLCLAEAHVPRRRRSQPISTICINQIRLRCCLLPYILPVDVSQGVRKLRQSPTTGAARCQASLLPQSRPPCSSFSRHVPPTFRPSASGPCLARGSQNVGRTLPQPVDARRRINSF